MERLNTHQIDELCFFEKTTDEKIIGPMLELFMEQIKSVLPAMEDDIKLGQFNELSKKSHSLKSSAAQLGLQSVADICLILETEGRRNVSFPFSTTITNLKQEIEVSLNEFSRYTSQ